jgi:hypothetical protein
MQVDATANMTIAERAAAAQKAKLQQAWAQHTISAPLPSAWDGLNTLAQSLTTSRLQLLPQNHQQEATIGVYLTLLLLNSTAVYLPKETYANALGHRWF